MLNGFMAAEFFIVIRFCRQHQVGHMKDLLDQYPIHSYRLYFDNWELTEWMIKQGVLDKQAFMRVDFYATQEFIDKFKEHLYQTGFVFSLETTYAKNVNGRNNSRIVNKKV